MCVARVLKVCTASTALCQLWWDIMSETSDSIAVGVPIYQRTEALEIFLESVPEHVETVYVADNGPDQDRDIYEQEWPFALEVLHLEHDAGIGACRAAIVEESEEPFVWVGDCDMEFTDRNDLRRLRTILRSNPSIGGVSGWLIEGDIVRSGARDLVDAGQYLIKDAAEPDIEGRALPFARFDFIPQCGLFRREALETYSWDEQVRSSEHIDFFIGHQEAAEWEFASTPTVMIRHNKDIDRDYRESKRGHNHVDVEILSEKWGYEDTVAGSYSDWAQKREPSLKEEAFDVFRQATPAKVWVPAKRTLERVMT